MSCVGVCHSWKYFLSLLWLLLYMFCTFCRYPFGNEELLEFQFLRSLLDYLVQLERQDFTPC